MQQDRNTDSVSCIWCNDSRIKKCTFLCDCKHGKYNEYQPCVCLSVFCWRSAELLSGKWDVFAPLLGISICSLCETKGLLWWKKQHWKTRLVFPGWKYHNFGNAFVWQQHRGIFMHFVFVCVRAVFESCNTNTGFRWGNTFCFGLFNYSDKIIVKLPMQTV